MEEIEVPTEHLHEHMHEAAHAEHGGGGHEGGGLATQIALSSALIAVLAAVTALYAGHHANEAVIEQLEVADQWSFFQAKGIKMAVLGSTNELLTQLGKGPKPEDVAKLEGYKKEQEEIQEEAKKKQKSSDEHLHRHNTLASGVTLFQVSIALGAMAALTKRRLLWYGSLLLGLAGTVYLVLGLM